MSTRIEHLMKALRDLPYEDMVKVAARLAELERNEGTLLGMIRHQQDVLRENLHDLYMDGGTSDNGSAG